MKHAVKEIEFVAAYLREHGESSSNRLAARRKWSQLIDSARASVKHDVAVQLLATGFLNEALARGKKTRPSNDFYKSRAWASARYAALLRSDGRCECCGASRRDGATLHVDHKKPRSKFPELALTLENLQVLCDLCNVAKSNIDTTDWSAKERNESDGADYRVYREGEAKVFQFLRSIKDEA